MGIIQSCDIYGNGYTARGFNGHWIYMYKLDGEVIYIGKTDRNLIKRLRDHGRKGDNIPECAWNDLNKSEIYFAKMPSSKLADTYEWELINKYHPRYNVQKQESWDGTTLEEPQWTKYESPQEIIVSLNKRLNSLLRENFALKSDNEVLQQEIIVLKHMIDNRTYSDN